MELKSHGYFPCVIHSANQFSVFDTLDQNLTLTGIWAVRNIS